MHASLSNHNLENNTFKPANIWNGRGFRSIIIYLTYFISTNRHNTSVSQVYKLDLSDFDRFLSDIRKPDVIDTKVFKAAYIYKTHTLWRNPVSEIGEWCSCEGVVVLLLKYTFYPKFFSKLAQIFQNSFTFPQKFS